MFCSILRLVLSSVMFKFLAGELSREIEILDLAALWNFASISSSEIFDFYPVLILVLELPLTKTSKPAAIFLGDYYFILLSFMGLKGLLFLSTRCGLM